MTVPAYTISVSEQSSECTTQLPDDCVALMVRSSSYQVGKSTPTREVGARR